mmetsp:Transcript_10525/g.12671  ORF Transcript_10525/g.12671 Transcript_10525/m.12671 type:complete len:222 (+) Transcript_10525:314-979(+)
MARIDRMLEFKEAGTKYFRSGEYELAKDLYLAGSDVYARYNYWSMDDRVHQAKVRPHKVTLMLNAASCYIKLSNHSEAITLCNDAIKIDENHAKSYLRRASAYISFDNWEKAKQDLLKVKALDANTPGLRHEIKRLQKRKEGMKKKQSRAFGGFLEKPGSSIIETTEAERLNPKTADQKGRDWVNQAKAFYGLQDFDTTLPDELLQDMDKSKGLETEEGNQ